MTTNPSKSAIGTSDRIFMNKENKQELLCKDCGLSMEGHGANHHDSEPKNVPEHIGRCCDCLDEYFGMPVSKRTRPRP